MICHVKGIEKIAVVGFFPVYCLRLSYCAVWFEQYLCFMMCQDVVRSKKTLLLAVFCLLYFSVGSASSSVTQLDLCYEETEVFPNFLGSGEKIASPHPGLIVELLQIIDSEMGELKIVFSPSRMEQMLA